MADTPAAPARPGMNLTPAHEAPETSVGRKSAVGVELGIPLEQGQQKPTVQREPDHGLSIDTENKGVVTKVDSSEPGDAPKLDADGKPLPAEEEAAETVETETGVLPALPAFDATKPEAVEAYTKAFTAADGSFNMAALSTDWSKNAKVDPKTGDISGALSEDTYKFLETKGIDRATAKRVEEGQTALLTQQRQSVFTLAGGAEKYNAAVEWARSGGYSDEAKKKFNTDLNAGGAAQKDAIDLLMNRYGTANPTRQQRQVSPKRSTAEAASGGGQGNSGVQPYETYADYQKDLREARSTSNQAKLDSTRARFAASASKPWRSGK